MDCRELNSHIYDYCDDSVAPQEYLKISKHLKDCHSCQQLYQLTRLENEVLRDTSDIPVLSPDFTSQVMDSIRSVRRGPGMLYNRRLWYGGLAAVAVVALFLFLPQLLKNPAYVNVADNSGPGNDTVTPPGVSAPADLGTAEKYSEYTDMAAPRYGNESSDDVTPLLFDAPTDTASAPSVLSTKQTPAPEPIPGEGVPGPVSISSQPAQAQNTPLRAQGNPLSSPDLNGKGISRAVVEDFEPVVTPVNVPPNLQLIQVDISSSNRTVYDYASPDGLTKIQITMDPFIAPEVKMQALDKTRAEGINSLARWVLVGDEMVTVTYSGNISAQELTDLANTVKFK